MRYALAALRPCTSPALSHLTLFGRPSVQPSSNLAAPTSYEAPISPLYTPSIYSPSLPPSQGSLSPHCSWVTMTKAGQELLSSIDAGSSAQPVANGLHSLEVLNSARVFNSPRSVFETRATGAERPSWVGGSSNPATRPGAPWPESVTHAEALW